MKRRIILLISLVSLQLNTMLARPSTDVVPVASNMTPKRAGCAQTTDVKFLDVNNVRALLMNGGDMWFVRSTSTPSYEVPYNRAANGTHKHALFAGSLWIGGNDAASGLLKVAAQTFRANGANDYWSGPLDFNTVDITASECAAWDKMWKINATTINKFKSIYAIAGDSIAWRQQLIAAKSSEIDDVIKEWPATGNLDARGKGGSALNLLTTRPYAPFEDMSIPTNGTYEWQDGDRPIIRGDQMLWWILNDKGGNKTQTQTQGIGLEISVSAFAFSTADVLNESTFYEYNTINRSSSTFDDTYFATWTDADLGDYGDDYVACDVERGLGILYNGDNFDGGNVGYGNDIPMIAVDFFVGPALRRPGQSDSILDMTSFTYFNSGTNPDIGDPTTGPQFYNYMSGKTRAGNPFVKTCTGLGAGVPTPFVFAIPFRECDCGNTPGDRRFVHGSGPITLFPGADNRIVIGAVWVPSVGGGCSPFGKIQAADDVIQDLFDRNFKLPFGPMAPDMKILPYDKKFVFYLNNPVGSNNYNESFGNKDSSSFYKETSIQAVKAGAADSLYKFEGYIVYQLANAGVAFSEIRKKDGTIDENKARIVFQCDKQNDVANLINYVTDPTITNSVYTPRLMVAGANKGIKNNFVITEDAFSKESNKTLINYKMYHYLVVTYAYNNFAEFDPTPGSATATITYTESRTDGRQSPLRVYSIMPTPAYDNMYQNNLTKYGDGVEVKRLEGTGNGGLNISLNEASEEEALKAPYISPQPTYKAGETPIQVKVINPDSLKPGNYKVWINVDSASVTDPTRGAVGRNSRWTMVRTHAGKQDTIYSANNLSEFNEQLLLKWDTKSAAATVLQDYGFTLGMGQTIRPGDNSGSAYVAARPNGYITSSIEFADPGVIWMTGVKDVDGDELSNWSRCGTSGPPAPTTYGIAMGPYAPFVDPECTFGKMVDATWAPYNIGNRENQTTSRIGVQYYKNSADRILNPLTSVNSVDIVLTSDRSKWTKCCVVEMNDGAATSIAQAAAPFSEGGAFKYCLRKHASLELNPDANGNPVYNPAEEGRSWFPGYAINQETGERLNIVFGEDSGDPKNNGTDMIFNPTNQEYDFERGGLVTWGGHHLIYVMGTRYDEGNAFFTKMTGFNADPAGNTPPTVKQEVWRNAKWVSPSLLNGQFKLKSWKDGIVPTTTRVKLRVSRPYDAFVGDGVTATNAGGKGANVKVGYPVYEFNLDKYAPAPLTSDNNPYKNDEKALLERIKVTPNPYYAYSGYEGTRLDSRVRIVNLPEVATIQIYSIDGTLVKTIRKNDKATTFVDWDVKNNVNIPVASGMYLIHVKIKTEQGDKETILKWFGIMRPQDITQF
jgi:hypothetical protein